MHHQFDSLPPELVPSAPGKVLSLVPSVRATSETVRPAGPGPAPSGWPKHLGKAFLVCVMAGVGVLSQLEKDDGSIPRNLPPTIVHGQAEPKLSETGRPQHWARQRVAIAIDASVDQLGPWARGAIQDAFGAWLSAGIPLPDLSFSSSERKKFELKQDGVNTVSYGRIEIPGHENDLAVTVAYSDPRTGQIVETDILINNRHPFAQLRERPAKASKTTSGSTAAMEDDGVNITRQASCSGVVRSSCGGKFDLQSVMTHEAGHFFGLSEDYADPYTTMFECTSPCETHKRELAKDDVSAMDAIYAELTAGDNAMEMDAAEAAMAQSCSASAKKASPPPAWLSLAALGFGAALIRRRHPARIRNDA